MNQFSVAHNLKDNIIRIFFFSKTGPIYRVKLLCKYIIYQTHLSINLLYFIRLQDFFN